MKFSSWNINGLRAVHKKSVWPGYVGDGQYDVVFLMETKCELDQLAAEVLHISGYTLHLQPSNYRRGYAGVAFYISDRIPSPAIESGWSHDCNLYDEERILTMSFIHPKHGSVAITGCYFPNGGRGAGKRGGDGSSPDGLPSVQTLDRLVTSDDFASNLEYKLQFFVEFQNHMSHLARHHDHVLVCGDINICHQPIDIARPEGNKNSIGFLPIERARLDDWQSHQWVDVFRDRYPEEVVYSWWDVISRARDRNVGWRIDSWWTRDSSLPIVKSISYDGQQTGSDHCPVVIELH